MRSRRLDGESDLIKKGLRLSSVPVPVNVGADGESDLIKKGLRRHGFSFEFEDFGLDGESDLIKKGLRHRSNPIDRSNPIEMERVT